MGLKIIGERPHEVKFKDGKRVWINDFDMSYMMKQKINIADIQDIFQEAFTKIWFNEVENDGLVGGE